MLFRLEPEAIVMIVPVLLFSLTVHEFAHAFAAFRLGDDTAQRAGRLTLNPLAHLDPIGTLMLFLVGFGYAKPVPINIRNLKRPRRDDSIIAAAGPLSNLMMAIVVGLALRFSFPALMGALRSDPGNASLIQAVVSMGIYATMINLALCVFNSLPVYPLDGSHVMENSLPVGKAMKFRESARY
ncbi:MAG: site-2 protease family protein, partial [Chrysiogenetes bacterium]|nr:site-2 protease family protein [Chrysiogenetes bacterium]